VGGFRFRGGLRPLGRGRLTRSETDVVSAPGYEAGGKKKKAISGKPARRRRELGRRPPPPGRADHPSTSTHLGGLPAPRKPMLGLNFTGITALLNEGGCITLEVSAPRFLLSGAAILSPMRQPKISRQNERGGRARGRPPLRHRFTAFQDDRRTDAQQPARAARRGQARYVVGVGTAIDSVAPETSRGDRRGPLSGVAEGPPAPWRRRASGNIRGTPDETRRHLAPRRESPASSTAGGIGSAGRVPVTFLAVLVSPPDPGRVQRTWIVLL